MDLKQRKLKSKNIREKYPNRVPCIVSIHKNSESLNLEKNKFLCPADLTLAQFQYIIRKQLKKTLLPSQAIFIFIKNELPLVSTMISELDHHYKFEDGFLHFTISKESTFGTFAAFPSYAQSQYCFKVLQFGIYKKLNKYLNHRMNVLKQHKRSFLFTPKQNTETKIKLNLFKHPSDTNSVIVECVPRKGDRFEFWKVFKSLRNSLQN